MGFELDNLENLDKQQLLEQIRLLQSQPHNQPADADKKDHLLHELQVHQIELEMQNRELREAQLQLEETRDNYADLYDFAPVNYFTLDKAGVIKNLNLTGARLLGNVRSNIIGKNFSMWLTKNKFTVFRDHLRATFDSNEKVTAELQLKNESGHIIEVRIESVQYKSFITREFECRSVVFDVTESNQIKNELYLQARQLRLIADSLPVLIAYIDINEKHLFGNKIYAETFGFSSDELVGKFALDIWGDQIYASANKFVKFSFAGQQINFNMELPLGEAEKKYFHATLIPDYDNHNNVFGIIVLIGDITDRLAIEAVDRKRLLEIAHITRLSTMGEISSQIAHELNQPLAAISIYSDACRRILMSGKEEPEKIIQSLSVISTQAKRAGEVISRIREFTSKKQINRASLNINNLIQEALNLLKVEVRLHKVELDLKLENSVPDIFVDKILIEQVIFNLARNALEAMDDIGESSRILSLYTSVTKSNEVEVSIHDTGPGLNNEEIRHIFEAFHSTKKDGMGMGLTISQSIIEAHYGRLWVVPNSKGGTTFCFTLPLTKDEG